MVSREEAIAAAGQVLAEGRRAAAQMTVEEQARAAYTPTGPSIAELEDEDPRLPRGRTSGEQMTTRTEAKAA